MARWYRGRACLLQICKFQVDERGVTAIEYCLIASLIAIVALTAFPALANAMFTRIPGVVAALAK